MWSMIARIGTVVALGTGLSPGNSVSAGTLPPPAPATSGQQAQLMAAEKKDTQKKVQHRKQTIEKPKAAPAETTGMGTREPDAKPEDAEPPAQTPERPYGILDMLIGR
jgi:hypothetical protein